MPIYNLTVDDHGNGSVTFVADGELRTVTSDHPNFRRITHALLNGEQPSDDALKVTAALTALDDRVSVDEDAGRLYFDGEEVHSSLTNTILRYVSEGRDTAGLVRFLERLDANPSRRAREELFNWLQAKDITIDADGYFIGYKGVRSDGTSVTAGPGYVDGVAVNGHIPNEVGSVITIDRADVQDDHTIGCSTGLHVGNYDYASTFGQRLLEVRVDPADVVSVPSDCGHAKLRCCRYEVLALHEQEYDDLSEYEPESEYDDELYEELEERQVPASFLDRLKAKFGR